MACRLTLRALQFGIRWGITVTIPLLALAGLLAAPAGVTYNLYFGNLHSHSSYSDGTGTPAEAYQYAHSTGGLDFLALTEHNHAQAEQGASPDRQDGLLIGKDHTLYDKVIQAADQANVDGSFVALYGQEFSSISKGNHLNAFMARKVITTPNGNYPDVFKAA